MTDPTPERPAEATQPLPGTVDAATARTAETTPDATASTGTTAAATAAPESTSEKLEKGNRRFTRWRRQRAFAAGLLMIISGAWILTPAYLSLSISNIQIQVSTIGGVSTLVIGILLVVCGLMTWFRGEGRILTGVAAMVLGIVALPQSNLGGFVVGTLLAVIGGALALAWVPQSKEDARAEKAGKKDRKAAKKAGKTGKTGGVAAGVGLLAALAVGAGAHAPQASAQLPDLTNLFPGLTNPGAGDGDGDTTGEGAGDGTDGAGDGADQERPGLPGLPGLPSLPQLPSELPEIPLPDLGLPNGDDLQNQIDGGLEALGVEIPGLNVAPPPDIPGLLPVTGNTFTITADTTDMSPNMKMSFVTVDTQQGPRKALRIDSDRTVLKNLQTQFLAPVGSGLPDFRQDTMGGISTLTGNFHIIVKKVTMTLQLMGVNTKVPITIDADWAPDDIAKELGKLGLGLPDFLSGKTTILNAEMDTYVVMADQMEFPSNDIRHWAD